MIHFLFVSQRAVFILIKTKKKTKKKIYQIISKRYFSIIIVSSLRKLFYTDYSIKRLESNWLKLFYKQQQQQWMKQVNEKEKAGWEPGGGDLLGSKLIL